MVLTGGTPAFAAAPVAADDTFNVVAGTTFTAAAPGVLGNDSSLPPGAGVHWQSSPPTGFTLNTDGSVSYVVPKAATGTASFTYCILDLPGSPTAQCISNLATVTIHIASPVTADDSYNVVAGTTFTVAAPGVLANDTNLFPGAAVHYQSNPPTGFTLNEDGSISYVVPKAATGTASFTYCILDLPGSPTAQCISNLATVTIHIASPVTVDDSYNVVAGTTFTVAAPGVLANDTNIVPGAYAQWQTNPPAGFTLGSNGSITYQVPADATGTSSFTYCILDLPGSPSAQCISNHATVTLHVVTDTPGTPTPAPSESAGPSLPTTGSPTSIFAAAGLALIVIGLGVFLLARRSAKLSSS
jgi:LPXTG-motif cell wall-anchored protein